MDRGAWRAAVHGVAKSQTWLSDFLSLFTFMHWRRKWQPTPVFLPGEFQGRGAWWAAVYGVAQSRTRLRWLSSSGKVIHSAQSLLCASSLCCGWGSDGRLEGLPHGYVLDEARGTVTVCASAGLLSLRDSLLPPYMSYVWGRVIKCFTEKRVILVLHGKEKKYDML